MLDTHTGAPRRLTGAAGRVVMGIARDNESWKSCIGLQVSYIGGNSTDVETLMEKNGLGHWVTFVICHSYLGRQNFEGQGKPTTYYCRYVSRSDAWQ